MKTATFAGLSLHQMILVFVLCLFWNGILVESKAHSTQPEHYSLAVEPYVSVEESHDEYHLIPFQDDCIAHVTHLITHQGPRTELMCSVGSLSYLIPSIDERWIKEQMVTGDLISGETMMKLPANAMLNIHTHEIHMTDVPTLWKYKMEERQRRRHLQPIRRLATTIGTKTFLVVRIAATDATTSLSATELANYVYGDDGNDFNLKYQTEACSFNQLLVTKASDRTGTGASISNGITTVSVSKSVGIGATPFINAVTAALTTAFSVTTVDQLADYLMYCLPAGVTSVDTVAYAVVNGYLSFYNNDACSYPSAQIHEIGHNYNMGHSSTSAAEYGDKSGLMGFSYTYTDIPKMCFNAAKSWQLGWYSSKADSIAPSSTSSSYTTLLAGIVDYSTTSNKVLVEVTQSSSTTSYYINYNRQTGINAQTQDGGNSVLILSKDTSADSNVSVKQATLAAGDSHTISNFNGNSGETLTITFNSLDSNEANLSIALTGFPVGSNPAPSAAPSLSPSTSPSMIPSRNPSKVPSVEPSKFPSVNPLPTVSSSPSVSKQPSSQPTDSEKPSISPSQAPSLPQPSSHPSTKPSLTPSLSPSQSPSITGATAPPTKAPSKQPTAVPSSAPSASIRPSIPPNTPPPTPIFSLSRIATIVIEIGIDGLNNLDVICEGVEKFLDLGVKKSFDPGTTTTIICTRGENRRELVNTFMDYEKPILLTVTSTFPNYNEAPRQFGFENFLEGLIISKDAQNELAQYIQEAMGSAIDGVHITLLDTPRKPILIVAFGEDAPTASPTVSNSTSGTISQGAPSAAHEVQYVVSLMVASISGGMIMMMML